MDEISIQWTIIASTIALVLMVLLILLYYCCGHSEPENEIYETPARPRPSRARRKLVFSTRKKTKKRKLYKQDWLIIVFMDNRLDIGLNGLNDCTYLNTPLFLKEWCTYYKEMARRAKTQFPTEALNILLSTCVYLILTTKVFYMCSMHFSDIIKCFYNIFLFGFSFWSNRFCSDYVSHDVFLRSIFQIDASKFLGRRKRAVHWG